MKNKIDKPNKANPLIKLLLKKKTTAIDLTREAHVTSERDAAIRVSEMEILFFFFSSRTDFATWFWL